MRRQLENQFESVKPYEYELAGDLEVRPLMTLERDLQDTHFTRPPENVEEERETTLLRRMRDELIWAPLSTDILKRGYQITREIGDVTLSHLDVKMSGESGSEVMSLLDMARFNSHPKTFEYSYWRDDAGHTPERGGGRLEMSPVFYNLQNYPELLEYSGIELIHPADAALFRFFSAIAHETGHALLAGVGDTVARPGEIAHESLFLVYATRAYMAKHPEQGFTGEWETDVRINEERFANGYGKMVIQKSAEYLGYKPEEAQKLADLFTVSSSLQDPEGENQIDHLDTVIAHRQTGKAVKIHSLVPAHAESYNKNAGDLGYGLPLTPEEMVMELREIGEMYKNRKGIPIEVGEPENWAIAVHNSQDPKVKKYLKDAQRRRVSVLKAQEREARGSLGKRLKARLGNLSLKDLVSRSSK